MEICGKNALTNLDGLSGITAITSGTIMEPYSRVCDNAVLPDCEVCELMDQLTSGTELLEIYGNLDDTCTPVPDNCP